MEALGGFGFAVNQPSLGLRAGDASVVIEQLRMVGVAGEGVDGFDVRPDMEAIAEDVDGFRPVPDFPICIWGLFGVRCRILTFFLIAV